MRIFLLIFFLLKTISALAQQQETPFQKMLQEGLNINSRESIVVVEGVRYQKIEIENDAYYIVFKGRDQEIPNLLCDRPKGFQSEHLIEGTAKIMNRKGVFLKALKESCKTQNGQQKASVELDVQLGFYLPEGPKDKIKNKQIGINPLKANGVNFSGEF